ncbi:MAG: prepilin-type N-terminal cleavage/methylation domain-containing protein [candidate division Zixibacteria bacterium]|nr:prepilin-type N-terminal cleavage/methylation domain-containing protein [candidate division Zixibacteria bacterium]
MRYFKQNKGFTLIEVMIVVVIIGILVGLAIPRYTRATVKAKQTEAKLILKQIYTMQQTYREEYDSYWVPGEDVSASSETPDAFAELGIELMSEARYTYSISGTDRTFAAVAVATNLDNDETEDRWQIDQDGKLIALLDDATN